MLRLTKLLSQFLFFGEPTKGEIQQRRDAETLEFIGLLSQFSFFGEPTKGQRAAIELQKCPTARWESAHDELGVIWDEIQQRRYAGPLEFIGTKVMAIMKNFCESCVRNRPQHLFPALFPDVSSTFDLPLINLGGNFFCDYIGSISSNFQKVSMQVPGAAAALDLLELIPLLPLENDRQNDCGFIVHGEAICLYALTGYGCPIKGYNKAQRKKRDADDMGDICHRTFAYRKVGLVGV